MTLPLNNTEPRCVHCHMAESDRGFEMVAGEPAAWLSRNPDMCGQGKCIAQRAMQKKIALRDGGKLISRDRALAVRPIASKLFAKRRQRLAKSKGKK